MGWGDVLGGAFAALALIYIPGTVVAHCLGLSWRVAALLAPGLSIAALMVAGVLAGLFGVGFTIPWGGLFLALVTALMGGIGSRAARRRPASFHVWPGLPSLFAFTVLASAVATVVVVRGIPSPTDIAWLPDNSFHLGTVEWMRRHESASLLDINKRLHG